jgi:fructose 1,6-bisphosphate aldolase/phosphatase
VGWKGTETAEKVTVSLVKADVGGFVGHSSMHPALIEDAKEKMESAKREGMLSNLVLAAGTKPKKRSSFSQE